MSSRYRQIVMLENEIRMRPTMPQGIRTRATKKMFSRRNASTFDYSIGKDQKEPKNVYVKLLSTFCQQIVNIFPSTLLCLNASHVCCIKLLSYVSWIIYPWKIPIVSFLPKDIEAQRLLPNSILILTACTIKSIALNCYCNLCQKFWPRIDPFENGRCC